MTGMKRICRGTAVVLLAAVLALNIWVLMPQKSGQSLENSPLALLRVCGGSMERMLHDGDVIVTTAADYSTLKTGDVVVFSRDGGLIIHEIIEIQGDTLITQGRANAVPDAPVARQEYRAKMLLRLPALGKIVTLYEHPARFAGFAVLVTVLIFGGDIFSALYDRIIRRKTG